MTETSNALPPAHDRRSTDVATPWTDLATLLYTLDVDDRLVAVNERAVTSPDRQPVAGRRETPASMLGVSIWEWLLDATTQQLFKLLFTRVRASGRSLTLPYRCDTPASMRQMEMKLVPEGDGRLTILSRTLRELQRSPIDLLDAEGWRRDEFVRLCSWCKRLAMEEAWEELDVAVVRQPELMQWPLPHVSHGMCDDCERSISAALESHDA